MAPRYGGGVIIDARFNGPPGSGNGGYSAGTVAAALPPGDGIPEVTLRSPPRLGVPFSVQERDGGIAVLDGDVLVAEARRIPAALSAPEPVSFDVAVEASEASPVHRKHPYPGCFVCGTDRDAVDGLRLIPGPVHDRRIAAGWWVPDPSVTDPDGVVRREVMWAALDCPSWFAYACFEPVDGLPLLGRLAADIRELPRAGERLISVGWFDERDGRKVHSGAALYREDGTLLGVSRATWIILAQPA